MDNNIYLRNIIGRYINNMSKNTNFCFSLCLEVDKRDDEPEDPGDPCRRWTEALNPSSFHCCLSQDPSLYLDLSWSLCARLCALGWSVVCHRNLFLRKIAVIRHTTLSFSNFLLILIYFVQFNSPSIVFQ